MGGYHKSDADIYSLGLTFLHMAILKGFKDGLNKRKNYNQLEEAIKSVKFDWAKDLIIEMLKSKDKGEKSMAKCRALLPGDKKTESYSV